MTAATVAAGLTCLSIWADVCGVLTLKTELTADLIKSLNLCICELLGTAENLCLVHKLCIELNRLHLVVCVEERVREGECTVVCKKNCIIVLEVL